MTDQLLVPADRRTYSAVGVTLLGGLWLSIAVMVFGLAVTLLAGRWPVRHVLPLDQVVPHLLNGDPATLVDLGILLLFATPLAAVLVALTGFVMQRDAPFIVIAVLLVLILAAAFGIALR